MTYKVQTGYKLWSSNTATSPTKSADGDEFEIYLTDAALRSKIGVALVAILLIQF